LAAPGQATGNSLRPSVASREQVSPVSARGSPPRRSAVIVLLRTLSTAKPFSPSLSRRPCRVHPPRMEKPAISRETNTSTSPVCLTPRKPNGASPASITSGVTVPWPQLAAFYCRGRSFTHARHPLRNQVRTAAAQALPRTPWLSTFRLGAECPG
jgi:hypothetical protein